VRLPAGAYNDIRRSASDGCLLITLQSGWIAEGAIIGSANASANGLGEEDIETSSEAEAAIYTDEPEVFVGR
jgi:hypothetical protein